jgi:hypothetical protein
MKKSLVVSVFSVLFVLRGTEAEESKLLPPGAAALKLWSAAEK